MTPRALLTVVAVTLAACSAQTPGRAFTPAAGQSASYQQTLTLTCDSVGGVAQNDLRVTQSIDLSVGERSDDGSSQLLVRIGRVQIWVGDLGGAPVVDTGDEGFAAAERLYASEESGLGELLGALWASGSGTESQLRVSAAGRVLETRRDPLIAERLEGIGAEHLATVVLESVLGDPAHLIVPIADGDSWEGRIESTLALWDATIPLEVRYSVTGLDDAGLSLGVVADALTNRALGVVHVGHAGLVGTARLAADGLAERIDWTLELDVTVPGVNDAPTRSTARLAHALRRANGGGE